MAESAAHLVALVLLPLEYHRDPSGHRRQVEEQKYLDTMAEIARRFGGGMLWRWPFTSGWSVPFTYRWWRSARTADHQAT